MIPAPFKYLLGSCFAFCLWYFYLLVATLTNVNSNEHCCVMPTNTTTWYGNCTDAFFTDSDEYYYDWSQRLGNLCIGGICYFIVLTVLLGLVMKFGDDSSPRFKSCWWVAGPLLLCISSYIAWIVICLTHQDGNFACQLMLPKQETLAQLVEFVPVWCLPALFLIGWGLGFFGGFCFCWGWGFGQPAQA